MRTLLWFRGKDMRVDDHAPLSDAAREGEIIPVFILENRFFAKGVPNEMANRIQFLLESLKELEMAISNRGSKLLVFSGDSVELIPLLAQKWQADRVLAYRWTEPFGRQRDELVREKLRVPFLLYEGETLVPPGTLRTANGKPHSVFTRFAAAFHKAFVITTPLPAPSSLPPLPRALDLQNPSPVKIPSCEELGLATSSSILRGGETSAQKRLKQFLDGPIIEYSRMRDRLDVQGTSRLSADLKFGTISARTVWRSIASAVGYSEAGNAFLNELIWRDFNYHTLWDRPELLIEPFRPEFKTFPWAYNESLWNSWVQGKTGYPVVDASARQLLAEGFVHNRARMISASFLTKHLLIDYRKGEAHYMRYLTDGDWAQNNANWQWSAGCGCDAQPFFRVFNPIAQGEKFDPSGSYVRQWIPELANMPVKYIHMPWQAPVSAQETAGVEIGKDYPRPVVDHSAARQVYLAVAKKHLKRSK